MPVRPSPLVLAVATTLGWGLCPWVDDVGLLVFASAVGFAGLAATHTRWALGTAWLGSLLQFAWLPGLWTAAHLDGGIPVWLGVGSAQALPAMLALWAVRAAERPVLATTIAWTVAAGLAPFVSPLPALHALHLAESALWIGPAAIGGSTLLTGVAAGWGALSWHHPRWGLGAAVVWLGLGVLTLQLPSSPGTLSVTVVQPDLPTWMAQIPSQQDPLEQALLRAIDASNADVVVLPEGAWPHDPGEQTGSRREAFLARLPERVVLLGASVGRAEEPRTNSALWIADKTVERFDKVRLVPLWEHSWGGWGRDVFVAGSRPRVLKSGVGVLVCYEDLFPDAIAALQGADWIATLTNDSWLGPAGKRAHLAAARLTAISTGRPLVRAALDGPSAVFDRFGRTLAVLNSPTEPGLPGRSLEAHILPGGLAHPGGWLGPWLPWLGLVLAVFLKQTQRW